jgi:peptidoglycan/xylan/chitin deacetylase (PgdA/CDA1 family)
LRFLFIFFFFIAVLDGINALESGPDIVVFCYHRFGLKNQALSVDVKTLESQIDLARKKGFNVISEDTLKNFYYNNGVLKEKNLLITVDDGFGDSFKQIYPFFKKNNLPFTAFIYPGSIGANKYLNWKMIKEMSKNNINFGSHSFSHFSNLNFLKLTGIKLTDKLNKELLVSSELIETETGKKVISYAHPYGIYDPTIEKITNIRYKLVFTTAKGPNNSETDPHRLNRYIIRNDLTLSDIGDYLDYKALPVIKTYPDNGGFIGKEKLIIFYFQNNFEQSRFKNFSFIIDGENKEFKANIGRRIVWFDCKNVKRRVYDISLKCYDELNNKYIYSILVNSENI